MAALHWLIHFLNDPQSQLRVVYLDHQLREVGHEKALILALGNQYGLKTHIRKLPVQVYATRHRCSIETAGRHLRRRLLAHLANGHGASAVITAHHRDDACESLMMQLLRGAKSGWVGMRPIQSLDQHLQLVRPLMATTKSEILKVVEEQGWQYCVDPTNADPSFTRNRIRHQLMPHLEKLDPNYADKFWKTMTYLQEVSLGIDDTILPILAQVEVENGQVQISREVVSALPDWLLKPFLLRFLQRHVTPDQPDKQIVDVQVSNIVKLVRRGFGQWSLPGGGRLEVEKSRIILYDNGCEKPS